MSKILLMNSENIETSVVIVGGGPVGLTLALTLARHQIHSVVLEQNFGPSGEPKCNMLNMRSMEIFRALQLEDALRSEGLSPDIPHAIKFLAQMNGPSLAEFDFPSPQAAQHERRVEAFGSLKAAVSPLRISQMHIEPVLLEAARCSPYIRLRLGCEVTQVFEGEDAVWVTATPTGAGQDTTHLSVKAPFCVGCDGGNSLVRRTLGSHLDGVAEVSHLVAFFFQSQELAHKITSGRAVMYMFGMKTPFVLSPVDDRRHLWIMHKVLSAQETRTQWGPGDARAVFEQAFPFHFDYTVKKVNPWTARILNANRYSSHRLFIAGDAAHLFTPTGGLGLNTGVGEAFNLGWKLAARIQGWGGPLLLPTYETERRPVAQQNLAAAHANARQLIRVSSKRRLLRYAGPLRALLRPLARRFIKRNTYKEFHAEGLLLGYDYADSPVICREPGVAPPMQHHDNYVESTVPGVRAPHVSLSPGSVNLHDLFGPGFTLLCTEAKVDADLYRLAAQARGIPLTVVMREDAAVKDKYGYPLTLIRPDGHVAWRGGAVNAAHFLACLERASGFY